MEAKDYSIIHCRDGNLYINRSIGTDFRSKDSKCLSNEDLEEIESWIKQNNEYVRKDVFIKEVCEWLCKGGSGWYLTSEFGEDTIDFVKLAEDFKSYMEG